MTIISTTVGKNPLEKWSSHLSQWKSPKCNTWVQSQKRQNDLCSFPRQTIQYHSNPSLCHDQHAEEAEVEWFYEDLQGLLELTSKKDVLFIIGDWNAKVGSQEIPGVTSKFGLKVQNEAGKRLTEFCQENTLVIANSNGLFQQHKRRLYTWTSADGQYWKSDWLYSLRPKMEKLYTVSKNKTGSWLCLRSWTSYSQVKIKLKK